jgi:lipoprotein-anchoring transpeptidase ErfK/SrfK
MRRIITLIILIVAGITLFSLIRESRVNKKQNLDIKKQPSVDREILYYTCGMHPQVRVSVEEYNKGKTKDPLCGMDLVPVYKSAEGDKNVMKLDSSQTSLAGIETFTVKPLSLFKEIRTVGVVAYDPHLRTAEEEYIQALSTYEKISQSGFQDAKERAKEILEAAKLKLELLGLNEEWIENLNKSRLPHKSLILPDKFMWVYADIYEYEATWPQKGTEVDIFSQVDPSVVFKGEIKSIEPVIEKKTRTLKLKIRVENRENLLKPNMYVDVFIKTSLGNVLSIPKNAVLDTGERKIAYVDLGDNRYQLREIKVGPLAEGQVENKKMNFYPLVEGIKKGEKVVLKGNYLLDSQSQLGAAGAVYGGALDTEERKAKPPAGHVH